MTYQETIDYLYSQHPAFESKGAGAYKPGLGTSMELDELFGHPHRNYATIHVAGTNGKGSVSHLLATILQLNGYKVGLYTSPHLVDFRERIRVNGKMIPQAEVIDFIDRYRKLNFCGKPSFFELTSTMAFDYFSKCNVDVAVIEVGLGGRLDSTNIITPSMCVITNISLDHMQFLGNTTTLIAKEKAGIIKPGVPVVIGESQGAVRQVFADKAHSVNAPITFADDVQRIMSNSLSSEGRMVLHTTEHGTIENELIGEYQIKNANTVLAVTDVMKKIGFKVSEESLHKAFSSVCEVSGFMGRWTKLHDRPTVVCDTGHNPGGWTYISHQLKSQDCATLRMVIGFVSDKDVRSIVGMMPTHATYYFTQAAIDRALSASTLAEIATEAGLKGSVCPSVVKSYEQALADSAPGDFIFVGGSTYVVAELLSALQAEK